MRKYILPLLVAGAVAFTAAQAMATDNIHNAAFTEEHVQGDHYKTTDNVESGAHGMGAGGWQLSSAILKSLGSTGPGAFDGDDSWGYTTGANPFVNGYAGGAGGETDFPLAAPAYTLPCPEWVSTGGIGTCPSQTGSATDPQTEDPAAIWDGTVTDDLYQAMGDEDSTFATFVETTAPTVIWSVKNTRFIDQTLDAFFYNGRRGTVGLGGSATNTLAIRHYKIDQTLDQDLADYLHEYEGTNTSADVHETMGIFGKLTQLFELGGRTYTAGEVAALGFHSVVGQNGGAEGCASYGAESGDCSAVENGGGAIDGMGFNGEVVALDATSEFAHHLIDQWVVSEVYDWHPYNGTDPDLAGKYQGRGVMQEYSSWFRDGSPGTFNFSYTYPTGHGTVTKTVPDIDHGGIDP